MNDLSHCLCEIVDILCLAGLSRMMMLLYKAVSAMEYVEEHSKLSHTAGRKSTLQLSYQAYHGTFAQCRKQCTCNLFSLLRNCELEYVESYLFVHNTQPSSNVTK